MHAVILAGGRGIRLRPYTTALPKPLVPLGDDEVMLDVILTQLARQGFTSVTLAIHHQGHLIRAYVGSGEEWGLQVDYSTETQPLGTFGPLFELRDRLPEHFLVMNGDILTDLPFGDLLAEHASCDAPLTVATYVTQHQVEFGVLDLRGEHIRGFTEKPTLTYHVSMGVYAMSRSLLDHYQPGTPCGVDELILDLIDRQDYPACYPFTGLWRDIGRPADYDAVNACYAQLRPLLLPDELVPHANGTPLPATNGVTVPVTTWALPVTDGTTVPVTNGVPVPLTHGVPVPVTNGVPVPVTNGVSAPGRPRPLAPVAP